MPEVSEVQGFGADAQALLDRLETKFTLEDAQKVAKVKCMMCELCEWLEVEHCEIFVNVWIDHSMCGWRMLFAHYYLWPCNLLSFGGKELLKNLIVFQL